MLQSNSISAECTLIFSSSRSFYLKESHKCPWLHARVLYCLLLSRMVLKDSVQLVSMALSSPLATTQNLQSLIYQTLNSFVNY